MAMLDVNVTWAASLERLSKGHVEALEGLGITKGLEHVLHEFVQVGKSILKETWETLVPELVQLLCFFSLLVMDILLPTSLHGVLFQLLCMGCRRKRED